MLSIEERFSVESFVSAELSVSLFADDAAGLLHARLAAEGVGARVIASSLVVDSAEAFARPFLGETVLVELPAGTGTSLDEFLLRLDARTMAEGQAVIVNAAPECLDHVAARLRGPAVTLLSHATIADRIAALSLSRLRPAPAFHESGGDDPVRLQQLAEEVGRIARALGDLAHTEHGAPRALGDAMIGYRAEPARAEKPGGVTAADVRTTIRLRRLRDRFLPAEIFADPAWDMLLDLFAARIEGMRVGVSSLCIASAVPPTTALRWLKTLTDSGVAVRVADPTDARRVFIELSEETAAAMRAFFAAAKIQGGLAV
ncbi:MAG: hypothetical protein H0X36_05785 [Sphingomonadaceae bacterium]|nr:hypothetical protein [Sphingomonadaceae bacterium]